MNLENLLESLTDAEIDAMINEAFEGDSDITLLNVKPKAKIPCAWKIDAPGNDNLLLFLSNFNSKSMNYKQIKPGDKFIQAWLLSLSSSGAPGVMKGNLGSKPFGVINAIFTQTMKTMVDNKIDGALFRFQPKKLGGKEQKLYRLLNVLLQKKGYSSRYAVLNEMAELTGDKYCYMVVYNKARGITGIKDIGMDMSLFNVAKTKVGEVVTDKKTGKEVTKAEAIAISVANAAGKQSESQAANKIHITKDDLIVAFSSFAIPSDQTDLSLEYGFRDGALNTYAKEVETPTVRNLPLEFVERAYKESEHKEKIDGIVKKYSIGAVNSYPLVPVLDDRSMAMVGEIAKVDPQAAINVITEMNTQTIAIYSDLYGETHDFTEAEAMILGQYFGSDYRRINNLFMKNQEPESPDAKARLRKTISTIDFCFRSKSVTLTPGTRVYRGMRVPRAIGVEAIRNKAFYFRNYVSTSLQAICFGSYGEGTWSSRSMADLAVGAITKIEDIADSDATQTQFGFMVDPADVPCIIAGKYSEYHPECEVLMPRGVVFKFDDVSYGDKPKSYDGEEKTINIFVRATAQHIKNFEESAEVVYDGDALMSEGVIKPMSISFNQFLSEEKDKKTKIDVNVLAMLISDRIPEKFNDVGLE